MGLMMGRRVRLRHRTATGSPVVRAAVVVGVLVRVGLLLLLVPDIHTVWFVPFIQSVAEAPSLDPWQSYLDQGGDPEAFPYGPVMLLWFGTFSAVTSWLPDPWGAQLGLGAGILVLDLVLLALVRRWSPDAAHRGLSVALLAVSPVVLYASYVHGQLDVLPTVLMFASALLVRDRRWRAAGLVGGLAVAAKFSSVFLPPLVIIFLLRNARFRQHLGDYVVGLVPGLVLTVVPVVLPGYRRMVVATPTSESVVAYAVDFGPGLSVVVLPIVFVVLAGLLYRFKRGNPELVVLVSAMLLAAVPLLTPASPGWYVWSAPLLAVLVAPLARQALLALVLFWSVAAVSLAVRASGARVRGTQSRGELPDEVGNFVRDAGDLGALLGTTTLVLGVLVVVLVYRRARPRLDLYRLSDAPLSVVIAGDSGTGKDTLCISLADVFGENATSFLLGDDYHLYERSAPLWKLTTHLHPSANDLPTMNRDALSLMRGRPVWAVHYDHTRGRFTKQRPIRERELVVVNGLHALTSAEVRRTADLTVFVSMDELLRRHLKITRDVGERGHRLEDVVASIERRYAHADRYIRPQADLADVVFKLVPVRPLPEEGVPAPAPVQVSVVAHLHSASFAERLQRALTAIGNCPAWIEYLERPGAVQLTVHPEELTAADTTAIAGSLVERPEELFTGTPVWLGQSRGVLQLVVVLALLERRKDRSTR